MKKYLCYIALSVVSFSLNAQEQLNRLSFAQKGKVFVTWGWNRAFYSDSDLRFTGPGYDFSLHSVRAHDRPSTLTFNNYLKWDHLTYPQTNLRIGYFLKDNLALIVGVDHMKYVMDQEQVARFSGHISDPVYAGMVSDGKVDLTNEKFLTFEHTDGLNYIQLGAEGYKTLFNNGKNVDFSLGYGVGAGVLYPKSNVKLFGNERSDWFHIAGFGTDVRTHLNVLLWKRLLLRAEAKYGYINMPDIKTTLATPENIAQQDFTYLQANLSLGWVFGTRSSN